MRKIKRYLGISAVIIILVAAAITLFCVFFDQAVIVRKSTVYRVNTLEKVVALTFDDGPSPVWTPQVLDELKKAGIKATFFMTGKHVEQYPEIAKRVAREGHEVENHGYSHEVMVYYKMDELMREIKGTEKIIRDVTGRTTKYFRPPKAWLNDTEKQKIKEMGYGIVLWSLNSKDWVTFHDKQITSYISRQIRPGDIILFHDSGGVFSTEGGDRTQTVKTIPRLVKKLKEKGYRFVTISELLNGKF
ncbi:MAG: polysaccharide deacetylase family protein [Candidatus Omnitrophica bacterium]|nr:polysaccharide deacetylase family protein [Candidatus Omnitrophota bacterium]